MIRPRWSVLAPALALSLVLSPGPPARAADPVLEVTGPAGTRSFTLAELGKLPRTAGLAGTLNSAGKVVRPVRYRGVALADLVAAVGGLDAAHDLVVTARDGYRMTYTHAQVTAGDFTAFHPGTGDTLAVHEPLTAVLAWEREGRPLGGPGDGPLRVVVVSRQGGALADAHLSVKDVTKVAVQGASRPWSLALEGARSEAMDQSTFESGAAPTCHGVTWRDPQGRSWSGIPLWLLVGWVDDARKHGTGAFADDLAAGYDVDVITAAGARVSLASERLARNEGILVVHRLDGAPLPAAAFPLQLAGPGLEEGEDLGGIVKLVLRARGPEPPGAGGPAK